MAKKMGTLDHAIRVGVCAGLLWWALLSAGATSSGVLFWTALVVAAAMLLTSLVGNCSLYRLTGLKTCRVC